MSSRGVILYGAPGTGKDATTTALARNFPEYRHFRRIKIGTGRQHTYRTVTLEELQQMRETPGAIIWENEQYGGTYIVDRAELERLENSGVTPVLHLGQPEAVPAVQARSAVTWLAVELHCARDIAVSRIYQRGTRDEERRLVVLDNTPPLPDADLSLDTGALSPEECAEKIAKALEAQRRA